MRVRGETRGVSYSQIKKGREAARNRRSQGTLREVGRAKRLWPESRRWGSRFVKSGVAAVRE